MSLKNLILLLAVCLLISCSGHKGNNEELTSHQLVDIPVDSICSLKSNIKFFGEISSMDFVDSTSFIIASKKPADIFRLGTDGLQVNEIGRYGKGPFEYISPSIVKVCNGNVYVWCEQTLKLIIYEPNGTGIREYTNFKKAIKTFEVYANYVVFYVSGGFKESLIEILDLDRNEIVYRSGTPSEEHLLLSLLEQAGGMAVSDSLLYYVVPDNLSYNVIDLNNFSSEKVEVDDKEFFVTKLNENANYIINKNRDKAFDYLWHNSCVTDICVTDGIICLIAELGDYIIDKGNFDYSERYCAFYFFDKNTGKLFNSYRVSKEKAIGRFVDSQWGLFFLSADKITGDPKLYKIKI